MASQAYRNREQVLKCPKYQRFPPITREQRNAEGDNDLQHRPISQIRRRGVEPPYQFRVWEVSEVSEVSEGRANGGFGRFGRFGGRRACLSARDGTAVTTERMNMALILGLRGRQAYATTLLRSVKRRSRRRADYSFTKCAGTASRHRRSAVRTV